LAKPATKRLFHNNNLPMGLLESKPREDQIQLYHAKLEWYERTIEAIEEHERQQWKKVTPGSARLALYWLQMLVCVLESVPRATFHACAWLVAAVWLGLALGTKQLAASLRDLIGRTSSSSNDSIQLSNTDSVQPRQRSWQTSDLLAARQLRHQAWRLQVYTSLAPEVLVYNLKNPWQPYFADGAEVDIHRPEMPKLRTSWMDDCCQEICDCSCQAFCGCLEYMAKLEVLYFRSNFFALSGCQSFQCGSCLGPCVEPCCYSPCVGQDVNSGFCKACEPEEVRLARWLREAVERKMSRTVSFYSSRPDLLRPSKGIVGDALNALPDQENPSASLLMAPSQNRIVWVTGN